MAEFEVGARGRLQQIADSLDVRKPKVARLEDFLNTAGQRGKLSKKDRLRIVDAALLALEMSYVHLPLKRAMHAVDPIQRLKLLRFHLSEMKESEMPPAMEFHRRMLSIFGSARDLHTMYLLPEPYRDHVAYLPFLIEQYFERKGGGEKFMVSRAVAIGDDEPDFEPGVEVLYWNGVPIRRAIEINGEAQAGSNLEARFARGLDNLTIRPLDSSLPPDEMWVDITYKTRAGRIALHRQDWLVYRAGELESASLVSKNSSKKRAAIDLKKTRINEVKRTFFAPTEIRALKSIESTLYAEVRTVKGRDYGYIRLFSFDVNDPDAFVAQFADLITSNEFPQEGLILDVRSNGGGRIRAGERLLQLFTPNRIRPELFEFINTPVNLEICRSAPKSWNLERWADSIAESVVTGATYSSGFPLNSEESCNDTGQVYYGPVLLITDALSYSTTDIFAAGFQDNEIGEVLGTSDNTGAGGANVWWYEDLMRAFGGGAASPFKPLPKGADMLVAVRRSIRVGKRAGRPLEELGIAPDIRHYMTRRDILHHNEDLIAKAAAILAAKPVFGLSVKPLTARGQCGAIVGATSRVHSKDLSARISRLDIYIDGRPWKSLDAVDGEVRARRLLIGERPESQTRIEVEAHDHNNKVVARRRLAV
jgi:hypothetical protein